MRVKHYKPRVQSNVLLIVVAWSLGNRGPLSIVVFCRALLFYGQKDVPTFLYLVNRCLKLKKNIFSKVTGKALTFHIFLRSITCSAVNFEVALESLSRRHACAALFNDKGRCVILHARHFRCTDDTCNRKTTSI